MIIYELYECNSWREFRSINLRSRLILTDKIDDLIKELRDYLEEEKEDYEEFIEMNDSDLFDALYEQHIDYLHLNVEKI